MGRGQLTWTTIGSTSAKWLESINSPPDLGTLLFPIDRIGPKKRKRNRENSFAKGSINHRWKVECGPICLSSGELFEGFDIGKMLFDEDSIGEGFGSVVRKNRTSTLNENPSFVILLCHQMDGRTGLLGSRLDDRIVDSQSVHSLTSETGQKGWMDVEDSTGESSKDFGWQ